MIERIHTLVVDDEEAIRSTLKRTLEQNGHVVTTSSNGDDALRLLRDTRFDAAILDLKLGGRIDGIRIMEAIRWRWPGTAVIILTAHGSLDSAIDAIRRDVDDYLLKPIQPSKVRRAVEDAVEQRQNKLAQEEDQSERVVNCGDFSVNLGLYQASRDGQPLDLESKELELLVHLMQNADRVVPPPELVQVVRNYEPDNLHEARQIIKWYIYRLRQAVEPDPSNPRYIINVRGVGYRFSE